MKQSTEIRDLVRRSHEALSAGDLSFFEQSVSQQNGVLVIGTDPGEWWTGHDTIVTIFKTQLEEMGQIKVTEGTIQAFSEGSVGWAQDRPTIHLGDGTAIPIRLTIVAHQEDGDWKIVQWHVSTGATNEEVIGKQLTTE